MSKIGEFVKTHKKEIVIGTVGAVCTVAGYFVGRNFGSPLVKKIDKTAEQLFLHMIEAKDWTHGEFYDFAGIAVKDLGPMADTILKDGVLNEDSVVTHAIIFAEK